MSAYKCTFRLQNRAGDCTSRSCGARSMKRRWTRWEKGGWRRRTNERATASRSLLPTYPRSLVLICLLGFRATDQNSSCLSFGLFRLTVLSLSLSPPATNRSSSVSLSSSSSFSFYRPFFFLYAISLPIHRSLLGPWKDSRLRQTERRGSGHSSEAFSNRIPHCRLGNSRRIEITHYPVMSGAFTSTQGCTQRWSRVHTCFFAYTRPRHATMLHLHSHRSWVVRLGRRANAVTGFFVRKELRVSRRRIL